MPLPYWVEFPQWIIEVPDNQGGNFLGTNKTQNWIALNGKCSITWLLPIYVEYVNLKISSIHCWQYNNTGECNSNPSTNCPFHNGAFKITNTPIVFNND